MEATTNLIGGQPFSMANLRGVRKLASQHGIPVIVDCSLISKNAYFIKRREPNYKDCSIRQIVLEMMSHADLIYLSGRKSTCVRGGLIATNNPKYFESLKAWLPVYEGFITYGGMSSKEIEAMAVGLREMTDLEVASSSADLIAYFVGEMVKRGIPAVTPPGGLRPCGCHEVHSPRASVRLSGRRPDCGHLSHQRRPWHGTRLDLHGPRCPRQQRAFGRGTLPAGRSAASLYGLAHGLRRGPRRLAAGPSRPDRGAPVHSRTARVAFFTGRLEALNDWGTRLAAAYQADFGAETLKSKIEPFVRRNVAVQAEIAGLARLLNVIGPLEIDRGRQLRQPKGCPREWPTPSRCPKHGREYRPARPSDSRPGNARASWSAGGHWCD